MRQKACEFESLFGQKGNSAKKCNFLSQKFNLNFLLKMKIYVICDRPRSNSVPSWWNFVLVIFGLSQHPSNTIGVGSFIFSIRLYVSTYFPICGWHEVDGGVKQCSLQWQNSFPNQFLYYRIFCNNPLPLIGPFL